MLCLTRKPGEKIAIQLPNGKEIVVTVIRLQPHRVNLGFEAPDDVRIVRTELLPTEGTDDAVQQG